jgi:hypothetical protein
MIKWLSCLFILFVAAATAQSAPILSENFNDITTLPGAGWVQTNNSSLLGSTGWFQGNDPIFPAQGGPADSYIAANFNNAAFGGNISNWLLTPTLSLNNGDSLSFYTRTETASPYPDRLEVRWSANGNSSDVGALDTSVGDFTTLLLTVNPTLAGNGYPDTWTEFTATVSGLPGPESGRFAFRYVVPDTSINGDYIGIDTVSVANATSVPEPSTLLFLGTVIMSVAGLRRRFATRKQYCSGMSA